MILHTSLFDELRFHRLDPEVQRTARPLAVSERMIQHCSDNPNPFADVFSSPTWCHLASERAILHQVANLANRILHASVWRIIGQRQALLEDRTADTLKNCLHLDLNRLQDLKACYSLTFWPEVELLLEAFRVGPLRGPIDDLPAIDRRKKREVEPWRPAKHLPKVLIDTYDWIHEQAAKPAYRRQRDAAIQLFDRSRKALLAEFSASVEGHQDVHVVYLRLGLSPAGPSRLLEAVRDFLNRLRAPTFACRMAAYGWALDLVPLALGPEQRFESSVLFAATVSTSNRSEAEILADDLQRLWTLTLNQVKGAGLVERPEVDLAHVQTRTYRVEIQNDAAQLVRDLTRLAASAQVARMQRVRSFGHSVKAGRATATEKISASSHRATGH